MSFVVHVPKLNFETIQMNYDNNSLVIFLYLIVNIYNKNQQMMHLNKNKKKQFFINKSIKKKEANQ
jgi:hypothetical protein